MELTFDTLFDKANELHVKRHGVKPEPFLLNPAVEATLRRYQSPEGRNEALFIASAHNPQLFCAPEESVRIVEAVSAAVESIMAEMN